MEDDELVSITADAQDAWEMDRVEFYLDKNKLGESTVAPFSLRWTIAMSNVVPVETPAVKETRVITNPDGSLGLQEVVVSETKLVSYTRPDGSKGQRLVMTTESGFGAIYENGVLTETHRITVKAFDRAGNEAESKPVQILVMHKPKEKKVGAGGDAGWAISILAPRPRDERLMTEGRGRDDLVGDLEFGAERRSTVAWGYVRRLFLGTT
jgi:hypothetical protein